MIRLISFRRDSYFFQRHAQKSDRMPKHSVSHQLPWIFAALQSIWSDPSRDKNWTINVLHVKSPIKAIVITIVSLSPPFCEIEIINVFQPFKPSGTPDQLKELGLSIRFPLELFNVQSHIHSQNTEQTPTLLRNVVNVNSRLNAKLLQIMSILLMRVVSMQ